MQFSTDFVTALGATESPVSYLRFSIISAAGAAIGRNAYLPFGTGAIYPNQYIILIGSPGSRKGVGMRLVSKLLTKAGYAYFAPNKGRKEALWQRMAKYAEEAPTGENDTEEVTVDMLVGSTAGNIAQIYAVAEEWQSFMGDDPELIVALTDMWDCLDRWDYDRTTKECLAIPYPTISLIGGATPTSFGQIVPYCAMGGGFMRRLLLVHGVQTERITFPDVPDQEKLEQFIAMFEMLMATRNRVMKPTQKAKKAIDVLYHTPHFLDDMRFEYYLSVRQTHLLKLCIISAACRDSDEITEEDVTQANTILVRTEVGMPQALGHFGLARNSAAAGRVLEVIRHSKRPISTKALYKKVGPDVGSLEALREHLQFLLDLQQIKAMLHCETGVKCFIPYVGIAEAAAKMPYFDNGFLTPAERI